MIHKATVILRCIVIHQYSWQRQHHFQQERHYHCQYYSRVIAKLHNALCVSSNLASGMLLSNNTRCGSASTAETRDAAGHALYVQL